MDSLLCTLSIRADMRQGSRSAVLSHGWSSVTSRRTLLETTSRTTLSLSLLKATSHVLTFKCRFQRMHHRQRHLHRRSRVFSVQWLKQAAQYVRHLGKQQWLSRTYLVISTCSLHSLRRIRCWWRAACGIHLHSSARQDLTSSRGLTWPASVSWSQL